MHAGSEVEALVPKKSLSVLCFSSSCQKTVVEPPPAENCHMQIYNLAGSDVAVTIRNSDLFPEPLHYLEVAGTRPLAGF